MFEWSKILAVASGGALGALSRFGFVALIRWFLPGSTFPFGIISVNILGSLLFGFFWALFFKYSDWEFFRYFMLIGYLGSLTTFSTFSFDVFAILRSGHYWLAASYILSSNIFSVAALFIGYFIFQFFLMRG